MAKNDTVHKTSVGGQALIEGVMMNGPKGAALSVRHTDGTIKTEFMEMKHAKDKFKPLGWPLIRGVVNFIESMIVGYKSLMRSAELSGQLEAEESAGDSKLDKWLNDHLSEKVVSAITLVASCFATVLAMFLFVWLPTWLIDTVDAKLLSGTLEAHYLHPLFEGVIRMAVVVVYMWAISQMKDIKRVFMYHGAEHKSICCYEKGLELTVENVRGCRRFHPRCGTNFIFIVLITSIVISSAVKVALDYFNFFGLFETDRADRLIWMAIKIIVLLPIVTGISYELIKYAGRHDNVLTKIFSAPGLWMQRITTSEPTDDMIEVGITSLKAVLTDNPEDDKLC